MPDDGVAGAVSGKTISKVVIVFLPFLGIWEPGVLCHRQLWPVESRLLLPSLQVLFCSLVLVLSGNHLQWILRIAAAIPAEQCFGFVATFRRETLAQLVASDC